MPKIKTKKLVIPGVLKSRRLVMGLVLVVLAAFLFLNKNLIIVGVVNNRPVWRWDLEKRLVGQYGAQSLDQLVSEVLISQAAGDKKISVSKAEVDAKIAEIEKTLQGKISLSDALVQQGMTVEDFHRQVELQLILEKLTAGQVTVSDTEIADYIDKNKSALVATDEAGTKEEAKNVLLNDKQSTVLRQYFTDLRSKAKITKFL